MDFPGLSLKPSLLAALILINPPPRPNRWHRLTRSYALFLGLHCCLFPHAIIDASRPDSDEAMEDDVQAGAIDWTAVKLGPSPGRKTSFRVLRSGWHSNSVDGRQWRSDGPGKHGEREAITGHDSHSMPICCTTSLCLSWVGNLQFSRIYTLITLSKSHTSRSLVGYFLIST